MPEKKEYGGWQAVATALCAAGFETNRQMVYGWWRRRDKIGFPAGIVASVPRTRGNGSRRAVMLPIDDVVEWRKTYVPNPGGRPRKER